MVKDCVIVQQCKCQCYLILILSIYIHTQKRKRKRKYQIGLSGLGLINEMLVRAFFYYCLNGQKDDMSLEKKTFPYTYAS